MTGTPPRDRIYLQHILDAIGRIESYLEGVEHRTFLQTPLVQDGVIRQLEIIGEASKRVTADLKAALPSVPWRRVAGMRDKLTHDYMGVDLDAVWRTAKADLAPLKEAVREGLQRAAEAANGDS